jgi:hypothetical protein
MDMLKATLIGAALLIPVIASAQDLSAQDLAPMSLASLPAAPANITTAKVDNLHGQTVGRVAAVIADAAGHPAAVSVVTSEGTTVIAANSASYDESHNTLYTDLPSPQLASATP